MCNAGLALNRTGSLRGSHPLASAILFLLLSGCGQKITLPPQPPPIVPPNPGTYNLFTVWDLAARPGDLASGDSVLYVVEDSTRVSAYIVGLKDRVPTSRVGEFFGLVHPVQVAFAHGDRSYVWVADMGDTNAVPLIAPSVKRYPASGGDPLVSFTDPDTLFRYGIYGLAADTALNVYVSLAQSVAGFDAQGRPLRVIGDHRSGSGILSQPKGVRWVGAEVLVADQGTSLVQRLRTDTTNVQKAIPIGLGILSKPADVLDHYEVDPQGADVYLYIADSGHDRVLRYRSSGAFADTVYSPEKSETALNEPITTPRFIAVESAQGVTYAFVSDPDRNRIVVLRLAK